MADFLAVTAQANETWNPGEHTDEMLPVIGRDAGMDIAATEATIPTFVFPPVSEQLSEKRRVGGAGAFMDWVAQVFPDAGSIDAKFDSHAGTVNPEPLRAAAGGM